MQKPARVCFGCCCFFYFISCFPSPPGAQGGMETNIYCTSEAYQPGEERESGKIRMNWYGSPQKVRRQTA